jgi:hypothetical protein
LAPTLPMLIFWPNCKICQIFPFCFLLMILTVILAKSNTYATAWLICCIEIPSNRLASPSLLHLASHKVSGHGQNVGKFFARIQLAFTLILNRVIVPIWSLMSIAFTVHISISILSSEYLPKLSIKFCLQYSKLSLASVSKLLQIPPSDKFQRLLNYIVR